MLGEAECFNILLMATANLNQSILQLVHRLGLKTEKGEMDLF